MAKRDAKIDQLYLVIEAQTKQFDDAMRRVNRQVKGLSGTVEKSSKRVSGFLKNATIALVGVGSTSLLVSRGLRSFIAVNKDFEQSLAGVKAVTQATDGQMVALSNTARELGASTIFSASEAAQGMRFLGQAGFETHEIIKAMPATLDLAAAGSLELAMAADIASNVLSGFNLEADQTTRVVDVLATTASSSNTNVEQLGEAMKFVAPVAAAFGISVEEASAAMGVLSDNGIQASSAGTGLRKVLSALASPTAEAQKELEKYGLTLKEVDPSTNALQDTIQRLSQVSLSAASALTIFGDRGAPAILALTGQTERLEALNKKMLESAGAAKQMAETLSDTLAGDLKALKSAWDELLLSIGNTDGFRQTTQQLTSLFRSLKVPAKDIFALKEEIEELNRIIEKRSNQKDFRINIDAGLDNAVTSKTLNRFEQAELDLALQKRTKLISQLKALESSFSVEDIATVLESLDKKIIDTRINIIELGEEADKAIKIFSLSGSKIDPAFKLSFAAEESQKLESLENEYKRLDDKRLALLQERLDKEEEQELASFQKRFREQTKIQKQLGIQNLLTPEVASFSKTLKKSLETPEQQFNAFKTRLESLRELGLKGHEAGIGQEQFDQAIKQAQKVQEEALKAAQVVNSSLTTDMIGFSRQTSNVLQTPIDRFEQMREKLELLKEAGRQGDPFGISEENFDQAIARAQRLQFEAEKSSGIINNTFASMAYDIEGVGREAFDGLTDAIVDFTHSSKGSFSDLVDSILKDLQRIAIQRTITGPLANALFGDSGAGGGLLGSVVSGFSGAFTGGLPAFPGFGGGGAADGVSIIAGAAAKGGNINAGKTYLVGEEGAELFIPPVSGSIVSHEQTIKALELINTDKAQQESLPVSGFDFITSDSFSNESVQTMQGISDPVDLGNTAVADTDAAGASPIHFTQNLQVLTGVQQTIRAEIMQMMPKIAESSKAAVLDAIRRGGSATRGIL